ncbi:hypothetical protein DUF457 [Gottschalkia acidurici 9a]|uniref:Membrane-bound metal-dependent hydrolase n=1 Tax=Gottschalkia acidurici (strain ATCC 7906 / DSM 604 / BCRC 14475 / CIP 104303 / KCTC 5404 / NCIMB 10678 / 9a) TaxID=1128398 RepID=K0AYY2_GOTA9|nr:metal-dependent hydrolase [Gottschalkia acidurici]AFS78002.1 hypothetical protein DUF457 [Gottschalkia acidurici 9a]
MDPVTHGIIGLGIATLSGEPSTINPITIGSILGAMSPDIDIVMKYWGDYKYLKHHRGPTHSIIALVLLSLVISAGLFFLFDGYTFTKIFIWTFLGGLSHTFFDGLNSYGVRPFMPFTKRKYLANLLMLYDPILTVLSISLVFLDIDRMSKIIIALTTVSIYILFRAKARDKAYRFLLRKYKLNILTDKVYVLPDLMNFLKWDFVIETSTYKLVGKINFITNKLQIIKTLQNTDHGLIEQAHSTELGLYFKEFTSSIIHTEVTEEDDKVVLKLIDLRYYIKSDFMHHATIEFNSDREHTRSVFHPYKYEKQILVEESI